MPKISSYPLTTTVTDQDLFVISDSSNNDATKSLQLETLKTYINEGEGAPGVMSLTAGLDNVTNDPTVYVSASSGNVTVYGATPRIDASATFSDSEGIGVQLQLKRYLSNGSGATNYTPSIVRLVNGNNIQLYRSTVYSDISQIQFNTIGDTITELTTTGTSGAATFVDGVLNIPQYSGGSGTDNYVNGGSYSSGTLTLTRTGSLSDIDIPGFFNGQYSSLTGAPTLATVATSGSYNDLSDKPTIPTVPANIVETVTTTDGTYIDLTPNTATDGNVTVTADLSAQGTADSTTFLRGDNVWATPSGSGGGGTVQSLTTNGTSGAATLINGVLNIPEYAGQAQATTWQAFYRKFTGSELKNAFNGSVGDKITLIQVPTNKMCILGIECTTFLNFNTGTTNYADNSRALAIYPDTSSGYQFATSFDLGGMANISSSFPFGIKFKDTSSNYGSSGTTGADIILSSKSSYVDITAGDRDFIITFTYRIIDLS
jgi:hypothetical protein